MFTFRDSVSGADNPMDSFSEDNAEYTYPIDIFYDGIRLLDENGNPLQFKAYIGIKGDTNFDRKVDSTDASNILAYYSKISTLKENESRDDIVFSISNLVSSPQDKLDSFAAFLGDVFNDMYSADNWLKKKSERSLKATQASAVLRVYSMLSTSTSAYDAWNTAIPDRENSLINILGQEMVEEIKKAQNKLSDG